MTDKPDCADCRFRMFRRFDSPNLKNSYYCGHPSAAFLTLENERNGMDCGDDEVAAGGCGPDGRNFERAKSGAPVISDEDVMNLYAGFPVTPT